MAPIMPGLPVRPAAAVGGGGGGTGVPGQGPAAQTRVQGARLTGPSASLGLLQQRAGAPGSRPSREAGSPADQDGAVVAFLRGAGLEHCTAPLLQNGFDDLETLLAIEDSDMKDLGIPPCDVVRMRGKLQDLTHQRGGGQGDLDANHPVAAFLEDAGLGQYAKLMLQNGFDDMDVMCDIEDSDMKELGIPRGHAIKLKKKLREFQLQQYAQEVPMPAYTAASHQQAAWIRTPQQRGPLHIPTSALRAVPTEQMKSAVEQSWEQVQALGTYTVGEILYRHTFMIMPEAIHLFPSEVRMKYREWSPDEGNDESNVYESPALRKLFSKFVNAVGCAVAGLHDSSKLVPMLTQLGARHISYGVREAHWSALGKAFTLTLRDILRDSFTKEVEAAWTMAYTFMSSIMIEGLRRAIAARESGQVALGGLVDCGDKVSLGDDSTIHDSAASDLAGSSNFEEIAGETAED